MVTNRIVVSFLAGRRERTANRANHANVALLTQSLAWRTLIKRTKNSTNLHEWALLMQSPACRTQSGNQRILGEVKEYAKRIPIRRIRNIRG